MKDKLSTNALNEAESPAFLVGAVISCFSKHHSYFVIPKKCKGKRMAFQKGWEAKQNGLSSKDCPYEPRIKNQQPKNPYHNYWHLGYECCQNSL